MFTKEIEEALAEGAIDLAVHSLKDLPTELGGDFEIAAITQREDPRDVFCSVNFASIEGLEGTGAIGDLISGNVQLMFESTNSIAPHVRAGRVRALAVTGAQRAQSLPEVPTLMEAGVPGYEVTAWTGVIAPAGLPRPILDRLNAAVNATIVEPNTKERLAQLGSESGGGIRGRAWRSSRRLGCARSSGPSNASRASGPMLPARMK